MTDTDTTTAPSTPGPAHDPDFDGVDWTPLPAPPRPLPSSVRALKAIPPAAYDIIARRTGVDLTDDDDTPGRKHAAMEWWWRNFHGQRVSFDDCYRRGSFAAFDADAEVSTVDPPSPPATTT